MAVAVVSVVKVVIVGAAAVLVVVVVANVLQGSCPRFSLRCRQPISVNPARTVRESHIVNRVKGIKRELTVNV